MDRRDVFSMRSICDPVCEKAKEEGRFKSCGGIIPARIEALLAITSIVVK